MSASLPTPFGVTTPAHNESFNSNLWCTATTRPPSISKFVEPVAVAVASSASCRFLRVCCKRVVKAGAIESPGSSGIEELTCVMKFGGSSVASAERMREVADLILSFPQERPVIVLSAMGKTTTNLLLAGEKAVSYGNSRVSKIDELRFIKELHLRTVEELGVDVSVISAHLEELEQLLKGIARIKELTLRIRDYLVSFGECLSTRVFAAYMNKIGAKARQYDAFDIGFITTDDFTNADILEATYPAVAKRLHSDWISDPAIPIVTGFLGKGSKSCAVTTFGSGGSDLTATTIGKALGLREIQVWKDVDGVLTCDPSIHPRAEPVPYLTFEEAAELAYFGAQLRVTSGSDRRAATMAAIGEQQRRLSAANLPLRILTCAATMALRMATLKSAGEKMGCAFGLRRWTHYIAQPPPLDTPMSHTTVSSPLVLPEHDHDSINNNNNNNNVGFEFPSFCFGGGSMELMAVPKRKVSPHKRGIRNGPKALKPVPVIIRCKSCGRVKLPHFYCCSGDRGNTGERNGSSS